MPTCGAQWPAPASRRSGWTASATRSTRDRAHPRGYPSRRSCTRSSPGADRTLPRGPTHRLRETVETWIGHALEQGGSDPAVRGRADRSHESRPRGDGGRGQGTLAIAQRHGLAGCSVRPIGSSRIAPPRSVTSKRRAGGRTASARSRPRSPIAASGPCGTCTPPWSTCGSGGSRRRPASPRSTKRSRPACHRTTMSMPSGRRCSRGPSSGRWEEASRLAARVEAASVANADTLCDMNWRSLLMAALALGPARR